MPAAAVILVSRTTSWNGREERRLSEKGAGEKYGQSKIVRQNEDLESEMLKGVILRGHTVLRIDDAAPF